MTAQPTGRAAGEDRGALPVLAPLPRTRPGGEGRADWALGLELGARAWRRELEPLLDRLGLHPGDRVLDAGCGSGALIRPLSAAVLPGGEVVGVDHDHEALAYAAWSLADLDGTGARIDLWPGSIDDLPFPDDAFDAAWCSSVLAYLPDAELGLRELVRVVRPGGRVVVVDGDAARWTFLPIDPALEHRLRQVEREAAASGSWGDPVDLHLGRRMYAIACRVGAAQVEAMSVLWERTAPLDEVDHQYLHRNIAWLTDPDLRPWLRDDWDECRRLFDPTSAACVLLRQDLHVLQTASAVILTV